MRCHICVQLRAARTKHAPAKLIGMKRARRACKKKIQKSKFLKLYTRFETGL